MTRTAHDAPGLAEQVTRTLATIRSDATLRAHLRGTQASAASAASSGSRGGGAAFSQPSSQQYHSGVSTSGGGAAAVSAASSNNQQHEELLFGIISIDEACGLRVVRASLTHHPADFPARSV